MLCAYCAKPMKQQPNGDYLCKCGQGYLSAKSVEIMRPPDALQLPKIEDEKSHYLFSHVAQLNTMLQKCEEVIGQRQATIQERLFKAKRNAPDSPVVEFWQAELDALEKLRKRVNWYRMTGTVLDESEVK